MFIEGCAVKTSQRKIILREVGRYPVQNDTNAVFMAGIDEIFEFVGCAVTAGCRIIACYLITPAAVKGMFCHRQEFQMGIAHFFHIGDQFFRQFCIGQESVFFRTEPAAQMYFINAHRRFMYIIFLSGCHPFAVFPFIAFQRIQHGCCVGAQFGIQTVRVSFIHCITIKLYHMEFIAVAFLHAGNKDFPNAGFFQFTHRMSAVIPQVEIAHNADCFCIGCPYGEGCALCPLMGHQSAAHFFIDFIVSTCTEKVSVQIGEGRREGIRVITLPCVAGIIGIFQLITEPFFSIFDDGFKKASLMHQFHGPFLALVCMVNDGNCSCAGQERTDCYHLFTVFFHFMHPQNGMRVTMFAVDDMENIIKFCGIEHILIPFTEFSMK